MRWLATLLIVLFAAPALSLISPAEAGQVTERVAVPAAGAPRVWCGRPETLRLRRFEDGSARLECAGRTIARIAVPG